jgi:hypothetical protein
VITLRWLAEELASQQGTTGSGYGKDHGSGEGNSEQQKGRHAETDDSNAPHPHRGPTIRQAKHPAAFEGGAEQLDPDHPTAEDR